MGVLPKASFALPAKSTKMSELLLMYDVEARRPGSARRSVPASTVVAPVNVWAWASVSVPAPCFFSAPAPLTTSENVASFGVFSATVPAEVIPPIDAHENASAPPIVKTVLALPTVIGPLYVLYGPVRERWPPSVVLIAPVPPSPPGTVSV